MSEKFNGTMECLGLEEMEKVNGGRIVFCDELFAYNNYIDSMRAKYGCKGWLDDLLPLLSLDEYLKAVELWHAYEAVLEE